MIWGGANVIITEIKCTINVMQLNHSQTMPPTPIHGKIVFHKTDPWCQNGWRLLIYQNIQNTLKGGKMCYFKSLCKIETQKWVYLQHVNILYFLTNITVIYYALNHLLTYKHFLKELCIIYIYFVFTRNTLFLKLSPSNWL